MKKRYTQLKAEWEFSRAVKARLLQPSQCRTIRQISKCMEDLHFLIHEIKLKYGFTPDAASILFDKYSSLQDKFIYEQFISEESF